MDSDRVADLKSRKEALQKRLKEINTEIKILGQQIKADRLKEKDKP